jgi:hypothetical protein
MDGADTDPELSTLNVFDARCGVVQIEEDKCPRESTNSFLHDLKRLCQCSDRIR